ncbi:SRPBCC family protein [Nocardia sp. CDC160]|uniref:SRPBCC family protein n=1 Tax=Nocardia sp. CDC160 TaxID=3112166 RepID=UPI002DBE4489|nr:SRPBCC family protein [Nocardia sp. CDC160]MEC3918273.1 SRPBCC family protein [Nocardia sp. CDC160]
MPAASNTVVITRPLGEVFAYFADATNSARWRSGVKEIVAEGEPAVGTVYRQTVSGPGGRGISADVRIIDFVPNEKVVLEGISGPLRPTVSYAFAPTGEGTEVTFSLSAELSGLKKLLMNGPVQKTMSAEVAGLDRAKALLESGAA